MNAKMMGALVGLAVTLLAAGGATATLDIETVPIGNLCNPGEWSGAAGPIGQRLCGAVDYEYGIGKYEVTAGQYCEFLKAVAPTDTYGLYNLDMDYDANPNKFGCNIKRTGSSGTYNYSVADAWADRPVNYVSWGDAARFANWLHNGQPKGAQDLTTTEDGSYHLNGATSAEALVVVTRETDATWVIPTEDEWYKAAYHKNDGVTGNYFVYPTSSNSTPSNELVEPTDPGNNATFHKAWDPVDTIGSPYWRTEVGAHENSNSPYGTFDQGGNVWEWNEVVNGCYPVIRGGSFGTDWNRMDAWSRHGRNPTEGFESAQDGFRVSKVPEPATLALLVLGGLAVIRRRPPGGGASGAPGGSPAASTSSASRKRRRW